MLSSIHRLPSFEIPTVMKTGKRVRGKDMMLIYHKQNMDSGSSAGMTQRFAFIVSKKTDKRATVRNRIKRILSESVRHKIPSLRVTIDVVCIGNKGLAELTQAEVEIRVSQLFHEIQRS